MKVVVPPDCLRDELEPLPAGVELVAATGDIRGAEVLVLSSDLVPRLPELLARLPSLKLIQSLYAGVEWLLPLVPPGVTACNASGAHDAPVAEWVVGAIIAMQRRFPRFWHLQQERRWDLDANPVTAAGEVDLPDDLEAQQVLIIGHGSIGRAVEERLRPFGADVVGVARHPRPDARAPREVPALVPEADVIVLLLPLTPATERLVDARFLERMRPGALLVNAARGPIVDTGALVAALREGRVRAALDVTDPEPLPAEHPLWRAPNVMITPHAAGSTARWPARAYRLAGEQLRRYVEGRPLLNVRSEY